MANTNDGLFDHLLAVITEQSRLIESISNKLQKLESIGGGGGSASIEDYMPDTEYERNTLLVDTNTETVYRVLTKYKSISVETDCDNGNLKLVGFESQIVTLDHNPTQSEIAAIPEDALVAVYSPTDTPYAPDILD